MKTDEQAEEALDAYRELGDDAAHGEANWKKIRDRAAAGDAGPIKPPPTFWRSRGAIKLAYLVVAVLACLAWWLSTYS